MPDAPPRLTHNVYVIELDPDVLSDKRFRERNPHHRPGMPCVYVGMTGLSVADRFENHRRGYKSSRYVKQYGRRLRPELFEFLNPMPYWAAQQMEVDLAKELREQGFAVWQG
jgi:hypothetical protein